MRVAPTHAEIYLDVDLRAGSSRFVLEALAIDPPREFVSWFCGAPKVDDYDACEARLGRTTCVQINVVLAQLYADLDNVADEEGLRYGQYVSRVTERECV